MNAFYPNAFLRPAVLPSRAARIARLQRSAFAARRPGPSPHSSLATTEAKNETLVLPGSAPLNARRESVPPSTSTQSAASSSRSALAMRVTLLQPSARSLFL